MESEIFVKKYGFSENHSNPELMDDRDEGQKGVREIYSTNMTG